MTYLYSLKQTSLALLLLNKGTDTDETLHRCSLQHDYMHEGG